MSHPVFAARWSVACAVVAFATVSIAQPQDALRTVVAENAGLTAQIVEQSAALDMTRLELAELRRAKQDLDERMRRIARRAVVYALGQEFAQTLTEQMRELPRSERLAAARENRDDGLAALSDDNLRSERALARLDDLDAITAQRLAEAQAGLVPQMQQTLAPAVRAALAEQRDLLQRLTMLQEQRMQVLRETDEAARELEQRGGAAREELTRFLFWIPAPPSTRTIGGLAPAIAWTLSPANWKAAVSFALQEIARRPVLPAIAACVGALLLIVRGRLKHTLVKLSPASVSYERYRIGHALVALAITFALALPVPLLLWAAAALLATAPDGERFTLALSVALFGVARLVLAISTLAWLLDRNGVATRHFGADEALLSAVARKLRRFEALFVPLLFMAALNGLDHAPFVNRESLARLCFGVAMITLAAFFYALCRRHGPLMQRLVARAPRGWAVQLHALWLIVLMAFPVAVAALAAAGYIVAAGYFFGRILDTLFLAIGAGMLYGLMALWVQVQRMHLARKRDEQDARPKTAASVVEVGSEIAETRPAQLDIAAIGQQARSMFDVLVTLLVLGGVWLIWREAIPALSVIGDYSLWTYSAQVDGKQIAHPLTVGHLLLATIVGVVTAVLVRNLGALLDIVLLQRLEIQTDATYAVKVIGRYVVTMIGILVACNILGIAWSDVQWLIAALGVGLGFGLQEIVANFVSGLIVLAERPIRIGDVVTVGGVSGKVASIHARATVVVDFDNKEVIIPNKAFITERVVNWTLSDQTTRLLIKVGVAYGSDIALVQRVLLDAVKSNHGVLEEPPPSVFFVGFGDSSLDFEIRAFVDSLDKRLRIQHEINVEVERVLRENKIEMPFPQRDLNIRSAPGLAGLLSGDLSPAPAAASRKPQR